MAGSLNKVTLIGNVGKDPEVRVTQEGKEIVTFPLATTETWKGKNTGERREKTEWHRIVIFIPALVNIVKNYVSKGNKIYIEGSLQTREWNDQTETKKYTTEVVLQSYNSSVILLNSRGHKGNVAENDGNINPPQNNKAKENSSINEDNKDVEIDDDIPF